MKRDAKTSNRKIGDRPRLMSKQEYWVKAIKYCNFKLISDKNSKNLENFYQKCKVMPSLD